MSYYPTHHRQVSGYYGDLTTTGSGAPMGMTSYDPYTVSAVPPLQIPNGGNAMGGPVGGPVGGPLPTQHRASSGAWNGDDDRALLQLRAMGKNWNQIQREAFPTKTGNACRKRHERLMERKGQNDMDTRRLRRLSKEYMSMRKEIWQPLAARCGEKWNVVESHCLSNGLKNMQSHARSYSRNERHEPGQPMNGYDNEQDDSGISGIGLTPIDNMDEQGYSSPETGSTGAQSTPGASSGSGSTASHPAFSSHMHSQNSYQSYAYPPHHGYSNSVSSTGTAGYGQQHQHGHSSQGTSPYLAHGNLNRLPSVGDMGIDAIINRGPGHGQNGV
ncbi:hypothetical protein B0T17DRAFT_506928 [Bombardia bombarda]|uniref:Myb-like domain-containing protein n=1 Tax=Bombardia bombarda TaxID=252184 RepID=A0AA40C9T7_9PEZI|nr:hypothetical protein B0T17DRAFT_506928 [Bombardia bombarda]